MTKQKLLFLIFCIFFTYSALASEPGRKTTRNDRENVRVGVFNDAVSWDVPYLYKNVTLLVSGPNGYRYEREFQSGEAVFHELNEGAPDGSYSYEIRISPRFEKSVLKELTALREDESAVSALIGRLREEGEIPPESISGYFRVVSGGLVSPDEQEELSSGGASVMDTSSGYDPMDIVYNNDVIIDGSLCVGFDCVNGESFGFDTIRVKENNTRIKFDDTSVSASFPRNDWQLTANDSSNGGAEKFSIDDVTGGRTPFTIEASAPSHSLYVDDGGRIGFGTSTPVVDLHVVSGNTPTLRLAQDGSSGFTPQTWDVAGNETNFFIRDATSGSTLPFRIRPGAPSSAIDIKSTGIGIFNASPEKTVHIKRTDGTAQLRVEETGSPATARNLLLLKNNGDSQFLLEDTNDGDRWQISNASGNFNISLQGSGETEFTIQDDGDVFINNGTVQVTSSREMKENFSEVESRAILNKLMQLPITTWNYKKDDDGIRHIGPVAEDFYSHFNLGSDPKHISFGDTSGVALAAVQALYKVVQKKDSQIADLEARIAALEKALTSSSSDGRAVVDDD
jgi:hypothetical protein